MAKAVVTLEGDSSSLVKALSDAKKGMAALDPEAKQLAKDLDGVTTSASRAADAFSSKMGPQSQKLSSYFKKAQNDADVALGGIADKLGGAGLIKGVAGLTAGFSAAQVGVTAFTGSMNAFYSLQGAEGAKAMADIDSAMTRLQSQLFSAIIPTDDLQATTQGFIDAIDMTTIVVGGLLSPLTALRELVVFLKDGFQGTSQYTRDAAKAMGEFRTASAKAAEVQADAKTAYDNVRRSILGLIGTKKDLELVDLEEERRDILMFVRKQELANTLKMQADADLAYKMARLKKEEAIGAWAASSGGQLAIEQAGENARNESLARNRELMAGSNIELNNAREALKKLEAERLKIVNRKGDGTENPVNTGGGGGRETAKEKEAREAAEKEAARLVQEAKDKAALEARVAMFGQATDAEIEKYKAAAEAKKAADQEVFNAARQIAIDKADLTFNLTQSPEAYIAEQAKKAEADKVKADADAAEEKKKVADRIALYGTASTAEIDAYNATKAAKAAADQAEFDAARQRAIDLGDLNFNLAQSAADFAAGERAKEKAAHDEKVNMLTAGFQEYGKLAGDQLAAGEKASKVAEKLAKKALGAQISALGDKAMAEAAIYAAAFNPMAIPMAAAGVAAYTAAAALGAEGKKATTATPAAAAPAAGPVNTAFNLRVDAAFADGESIARQFAMMQRSAQRRGLVPAGA
jgi:hypothetical protein